MKLGKFNISLPISNSARFHKCAIIKTTFIEFSTSNDRVRVDYGINGMPPSIHGDGSILIPHDEFYGRNAKIVLGPSTHSSNIGAIEEADIIQGDSAGLQLFYCSKIFTNSYTAGDSVTIIVPSMPYGWSNEWKPTGANSNWDFGSIISSTGYSDHHVWRLNGEVGANKYVTHWGPTLTKNTYYRMSVLYKSAGMVCGSNGVRLNVYDASAGTNLHSLTMTDTSGDWIEASTVFQFVSDVRTVLLLWKHHDITSLTNFHIAGMSIGHTRFDLSSSGGGTVYDQDGITDFDLTPISGSFKINRINVSNKLGTDIISRGLVSEVYPAQNIPITKYSLSYSFTDVPISTWEKIQQMIDFQNKGNLLNYFPGHPALPYVMTGILSARIQKRYRIFDLDCSNISLTFEEVLT